MASPLRTLKKDHDRMGKRAIAETLSQLEAEPTSDYALTLLQECFDMPHNSYSIGITGPPGVGKSTLLNDLIGVLRSCSFDKKVAIIAVDPSSQESGGALLGDRTRLHPHEEDTNVFIRSQAAQDKLGGLAHSTLAAALLLKAFYDEVIIETVGVGQSEIDIMHISDTTLLCLQPASGDSLQSMKAGVMEIADIFVVTKSDLGKVAIQTANDIKATLHHHESEDGWRRPLLLTSSLNQQGILPLYETILQHRTQCKESIARKRQRQIHKFLEDRALEAIRKKPRRQPSVSFKDAAHLRDS